MGQTKIIDAYIVHIDTGTTFCGGFLVIDGHLSGPLPPWLATVARREGWSTPREIVTGGKGKGWAIQWLKRAYSATTADVVTLVLWNGHRIPYYPQPGDTAAGLIERSQARAGRIPLVNAGRVVGVEGIK